MADFFYFIQKLNDYSTINFVAFIAFAEVVVTV